MASRLSEDPGLRVLLLEAGPDPGTAIPDDVLHLRNGSGVLTHDWEYNDPAAGAALPRGRIVGGSSAVNATIALRGQPVDYDRWAEMGAAGWGWAECLPYFRRLEADADFGSAPYHGDSGPIRVERNLPLTAIQETYLAACAELGHELVEDANEPGRIGAGPIPRNLKDWTRQSTLLTYIAAARPRPNFQVRGNALVDRVLFDGARAAGVRLDSGEEIRARHVVLAAGAYNTAALMLRSGLGPAGELALHGIESVVDLPGVGANLMDHPVTMVTAQADHPTDPQHIRLGPLLKTKSRPELDWDDLKISLFPGDLFNLPGLTGIFVEVNISDARGGVGLTSREPGAPPRIDHAFLSVESDMERMVEGVRQAQGIATVLAGTVACEVLLPDAETLADEELLRQHLALFHSTGYHPAGTCRMGASDDDWAVVDPRLRVRGVDGLHIVDASVMPDLPRCNINLPTLMIGERGADFIRQDL